MTCEQPSVIRFFRAGHSWTVRIPVVAASDAAEGNAVFSITVTEKWGYGVHMPLGVNVEVKKL